MNGYKTGGDWTDVTSIGRNEVVFEGRHKAYGAFIIRQRYQNALLFSQLSAIAFVAICAFVPYLLRNKSPLIVPPEKGGVVSTPYNIPIPPKAAPPVQRPHLSPPKSNASNQAPPVIANAPDTTKQDKHATIVNPNPNPGPVDPNINVNPNPQIGGGGGGGTSTVPKRDTFVIIAGVMPKFKEGNLDNYLNSKINYPSEESELGIQGTVYASFIINEDGSVGDVKLLQGISNGPNINKEALRVLSEMPKWTPGKQDGHPVRVRFTIPIHFRIH